MMANDDLIVFQNDEKRVLKICYPDHIKIITQHSVHGAWMVFDEYIITPEQLKDIAKLYEEKPQQEGQKP